jgi:hypothetical protein
VTRPFDRMRSAIANLARPDLRALALRVGADRDAITDFADVNSALDPACMAKLENWHADFSLRGMLSDPTRMKQMGDMPAAIGIDRAAYEAFVADEGDLPQGVKDNLRAHLANGGRPTKRGDDLPAFSASAQLPAAQRRRACLIHTLRDLPLNELERLVAMARKIAA